MRFLQPALLAACVLMASGCSRDKAQQLAKKIDPRFPQKAATHVVEVDRVQVGAPDFNLSTFGNPLDIKISVLEDGREVPPSSGSAIIGGQRGERFVKPPIQWVINFDPQKNYQIVLEEQAIIADRVSYTMPRTPRLGYWPVAENEDLIRLGKESYIHFKDRVAE